MLGHFGKVGTEKNRHPAPMFVNIKHFTEF